MTHNGDATKGDQFKEIMEHIGRGAGASTVYGEPTVMGDRAVIPVAEVKWGGGGGWGGGTREDSEFGDTEAGTDSGEGMGMGFGVTAKPVGALEVTADGVSWSVAYDWGKIIQLWSVVTGVVVVIAAVKWFFARS